MIYILMKVYVSHDILSIKCGSSFKQKLLSLALSLNFVFKESKE